MESRKLIVGAVCIFLAVTNHGFCWMEFKDGDTHSIDYAINDDVRVDYLAPGMQTTVNLLNGGSISNSHELHGYNDSKINIFGGTVGLDLYSRDTSVANVYGGTINTLNTKTYSTANIYDGTTNILNTRDSSVANIYGGVIDIILNVWDFSILNISGGKIENLKVCEFCTVTFKGQNFQYGSGLILDGNRLLGTGILSGEWIDGTPWTMNILDNHSTATIQIVPEPATLAMLFLGGVVIANGGKLRGKGRFI